MIGKDGGCNAAEAEPVFAGYEIKGLDHFVPDADIDVKARKVSSIHSCWDGIPIAAFRIAI